MIKKKILLEGGGFALYGYLPSIDLKKYDIYCSTKYKEIIKKRADIKHLLKKITFVNNVNYNNFNEIIFAKKPLDQYKFCKNKNKTAKTYLFLEKPLAHNYKKAQNIFSYLRKNDYKFSICYIFLYCSWFKILKKKYLENFFRSFNLNWCFKSNNSKDSWKNIEKKGGGIINFYGIQLLSLLVNLKFYSCIDSRVYKIKGIENKWEAIFANDDGVLFFIKVEIDKKKNSFEIFGKTNDKITKFINLKNPFIAENRINKTDNRVDYLKKYLNSSKKDRNRYKNYAQTIDLWEKVKKKNLIVKESDLSNC